MTSPDLILFSGLAADHTVFTPQKLAFPQLLVPKWSSPRPGDDLDSYSERLAKDLPGQKNLVLGGASFGGIVALHVAQKLRPSAVVLIGSVRSPSELSRLAKSCRILKPLVNYVPVGLLQATCAPLGLPFLKKRSPLLSGLATQFQQCNPAVFKWSLEQILNWKIAPKVNCPIYQIHGARDRVLPIRNTKPDVIIPEGGHVISLTHPSAVNRFINDVFRQVQDKRS